MTRWRCARWCCEAFDQPTEHVPSHLCSNGHVEAYVPDFAPVAATAAEPVAERHLRAVA